MGKFRIVCYLLAPCLLAMTTMAEQPKVRDAALWDNGGWTQNKYKTAHSKQTWMMALTLPYLLKDSVENKYMELFHNHTFLPYLMRSPILTTLPTESTVPLRPGDPKLSKSLDGRLAKVLGKVQNKAKEEVATKSYSVTAKYRWTNTLGEDIPYSDIESDWIPDQKDSRNFPVEEQKNRYYSPKIQPKLWQGMVNPRNHWEKNKTLINGISDSFDPDYDAWNETHPFPNGDQRIGGAYDSEISMLKRRSMCPNIIFHTLGPGEHPINNPLYMDSDYNFHDIPGFNGTYNYPNDSRSSSGESRMDPKEALKRAEYFRSMLNKTREERKIMDEYTTGFYDRDYCLRRKRRRRSVNLRNNPVKLPNDKIDRVESLDDVDKDHRKKRSAEKRGENRVENVRNLVNAAANREKRNARRIKRIDNMLGTNNAEKANAGHAKHRRNVDNQATIENIDNFINEGNGHAKRAQINEPNQQVVDDAENKIGQKVNQDDPVVAGGGTPCSLQPVQRPALRDDEVDKDANRENHPTSDEFISIQANLGKRESDKTEETDTPKTTVDYLNLVTPRPERPAQNDRSGIQKHCKCNRPQVKELGHDEENKFEQQNEKEHRVGTKKELDNAEPTKKPYQHKAIEIYHELQKIMESLQLKTNMPDIPEEKKNEKTTINTIQKYEEENLVNENTNKDNELREIMESLQLKTRMQVIPGVTRRNENSNVNKEKDDEENDDADKCQTYEETRAVSPQKERLEPADLNRKCFAGRKRKVRIDDNKLYDSIKLEAIREEYVKECKGKTLKKGKTRDFLDAGFVTEKQAEKCVDEANANKAAVQDVNALRQENAELKDETKHEDRLKATTETSKSHLNKCKFLYAELKKKYDMHLNSSERAEKHQVRERIQLLKDMMKHKYVKLNKETADRVNDYKIEKTEEIAEFPVDWYKKNKNKVRTSTEIEDESVEQELEAELKAARMHMRHNKPKTRVRRATKVLIRRNNATFVVSYKHLNLFRRKNVRIYLNHEHIRKFDSRKKRHVPERLESGFDSENEFDGDKEVNRKDDSSNVNDDGKGDGTNDQKTNDVMCKLQEPKRNAPSEKDCSINGEHKKENDFAKNEGKPIFLDINDLIIRHTDSITESDENFQGMELKADGIVDSNYGDPDDIITEKELNEGIIEARDSQNKAGVFEQTVNAKVIDTQSIDGTNIDLQKTISPDIEAQLDPLNVHPMPILLRRKRWEQPVYVTRPKGGWKKYIKRKVKEIHRKHSTKWRDRIIEWTTKHKWETLPDEKDRTTVRQTKKFLNIDKIRQMI